MSNKKYELTNDTKEFDSNIIEQFRTAINNIKKTIEKDHDVFELTI
ncbi:MAG: hypothetical protein M3Z63_00010 [Gilliamella apicola]|nr:hypothetical protein [Gilliamella apicola]